MDEAKEMPFKLEKCVRFKDYLVNKLMINRFFPTGQDWSTMLTKQLDTPCRPNPSNVQRNPSFLYSRYVGFSLKKLFHSGFGATSYYYTKGHLTNLSVCRNLAIFSVPNVLVSSNY